MLNNSTNRNEIASQTVEHKRKNRYTDRYIISLLLVPSSSAIHCEQQYDCWFILEKYSTGWIAYMINDRGNWSAHTSNLMPLSVYYLNGYEPVE